MQTEYESIPGYAQLAQFTRTNINQLTTDENARDMIHTALYLLYRAEPGGCDDSEAKWPFNANGILRNATHLNLFASAFMVAFVTFHSQLIDVKFQSKYFVEDALKHIQKELSDRLQEKGVNVGDLSVEDSSYQYFLRNHKPLKRAWAKLQERRSRMSQWDPALPATFPSPGDSSVDQRSLTHRAAAPHIHTTPYGQPQDISYQPLGPFMGGFWSGTDTIPTGYTPWSSAPSGRSFSGMGAEPIREGLVHTPLLAHYASPLASTRGYSSSRQTAPISDGSVHSYTDTPPEYHFSSSSARESSRQTISRSSVDSSLWDHLRLPSSPPARRTTDLSSAFTPPQSPRSLIIQSPRSMIQSPRTGTQTDAAYLGWQTSPSA